MPEEITISGLYYLILAIGLVGAFGHGFTAGYQND